jgi:hypothetical protein
MQDVETIRSSTAREFLDRLDTSRDEWLADGSDTSPWIFRGQSDANWMLIPSAWREVNKPILDACHRRMTKRFGETVAGIRGSYDGAWKGPAGDQEVKFVYQVAAEYELVHQFWALANELGFAPVSPSTVASGIQYLEYVYPQSVGHSFPPLENPITALAQHHGMPTRLLDFTHDPAVASFFAAVDVKNSQPGDLALWAIDTRFWGERLRKLACPRSGNNFLHVQHGVCIYYNDADHFCRATGQWPEFRHDMRHQALRVLTLPTSEARELLRLLRARRISAAQLQPTLDHVVSTLKSDWGFTGHRP